MQVLRSTFAAVAILAASSCNTSAQTAQTPDAPSPPATQSPAAAPLPPVEVTTPPPPAKTARKKVKAKATASKTNIAPSAPPPAEPQGNLEGQATARSPVKGIVAKQTLAGTKTDTPIMEIPQGISVITSDELKRMDPTSVAEALRYTPGVRAESFGNDTRNDWFIIRGFPAQDTGYYLDGLQLYSTAFATWKLEPWGLDRIEIIRGPSAVLYGGGNPGGLINGVSKHPGPGIANSVSTGVDEHGNAYGATDLNGQIGNSGNLYYRLNVLGRGGGTQVDHVDDDRFFIAPSLLWRDAYTNFTLLASYQRDKTAIQNFLPYEGTVTRAPFGRIPTSLDTNNPDYGSFKREQAMVGYEFEHRLNDAVTVRQNFRYGHLEVDLLGLYGQGYAAGQPTPTTGVISRGNFITDPVVDQFTVDNQAEYRFLTGPLAHKVLAGIDYKNYRIGDDQGFEFITGDFDVANPVYPPNPSPPNSRYLIANTVQQQLGVYLQDQVKIDRLTIALSGRHDWVNTDRDDKLTPSNSVNDNDTAFSGRAGAIYNFDNGIAPYFAYSTSFNPLVGLNTQSNGLLKPETGKGWEGGFKWEPKTFNGRFTFAYFDTDRSNVPATIFDPTQLRQIGEQTSRGFEYEGVATLMPGLDLISSYTIYDLRVVDDNDLSSIGKVPVGIPEQFGGVALDYTLQSGLFKGLGFGGGVRYTGRSFADSANKFEVPSYTLFDTTLHYEKNGWRTALNISNIFDDAYVSACSSVSACFYGERRKIMVNTTYQW